MCKGNGSTRSSWLPTAVLAAVAVDAAAAVIADVVTVALVSAGLLAAAGVAFVVHVLRRDGLRLYIPADVEPVPLTLAAARARAIEAPRTAIPGVVLDGQEAAR
jgi:hypothetical protein